MPRKLMRTAIDRWMTAENLKNAYVGSVIGVDRSTVWRWRYGRATPERDVGGRLIQMSDGQLTWDMIMGTR